jgi:hypothetical protein
VFAPGRLLLLATLVAGIISMHGLTRPSMTGAGHHQMVAAVASLAGAATAASPLVGMTAADHSMPMPPSGGHTGHDLLHTCVVVLTAGVGFAALALLAVALIGAAGLLGGLFLAGAGRGRGVHQRRRKPNTWSITQLCISRT